MSRRAARFSHDEVVRAFKAARLAGVSIRSFRIDGTGVNFVMNNGDIVDDAPAPVVNPDTFQSLEDYEAWRDRNRARGN